MANKSRNNHIVVKKVTYDGGEHCGFLTIDNWHHFIGYTPGHGRKIKLSELVQFMLHDSDIRRNILWYQKGHRTQMYKLSKTGKRCKVLQMDLYKPIKGKICYTYSVPVFKINSDGTVHEIADTFIGNFVEAAVNEFGENTIAKMLSETPNGITYTELKTADENEVSEKVSHLFNNYIDEWWVGPYTRTRNGKLQHVRGHYKHHTK